MASAVEILNSKFRGLYFLAIIALASIFLIISYWLSTFDSPSGTPNGIDSSKVISSHPALRFGISVTQKLGTDFLSILIFTSILLFAIRREPKQEIRSAAQNQACHALDSAMKTTREFIYRGSSGAYNIQKRIPILVSRASEQKLNVVISFLLPHPFMASTFKAVTNAVGDDHPKNAVMKNLAIALRLLQFRRSTEHITVFVYFIPHASTIRYDVTDEIIAMSSPLGGNPFVLFPREAPMYNEIRADLQISMDNSAAKISTADESVRRIINNDLALAQHLINALGAEEHGITPEMLINEARKPLGGRYSSKPQRPS